MEIKREKIRTLERKYRLSLINSISGIKPGNLIATKSKDGKENVAIFSSVVHIGSDPAELGFIIRPQGETPRDTYANIYNTEYYTINHIPESLIKKAHYTSAKLPIGESEFDRMKIEKEYLDDFYAPFVKESPVKIGMKFISGVPLHNGCTFMIGSIESIYVPDTAINELGQLNLSDYNGVGIGGLNSYYSLNKIDSFPYVRLNEIPDFE